MDENIRFIFLILFNIPTLVLGLSYLTQSKPYTNEEWEAVLDKEWESHKTKFHNP